MNIYDDDSSLIGKMLFELENCEKQMRYLHQHIDNQGLSLDVDRAYDGLYEAKQQLELCREAALDAEQ